MLKRDTTFGKHNPFIAHVICFDLRGKMKQNVVSRDPQGRWTDNTDISL